MPIRLGVFFGVPIDDKIDLTANIGVAYYAGLKFDFTQLIEQASGNWQDASISASRSDLSNLGFQGSLGAEYRLSPTAGIFVEAVGRYARFRNFDAATEKVRLSNGDSATIISKFYLETHTYTNLGGIYSGSYSMFRFSDTVPVDDLPEIVFSEPKIDLSGFSLQAGFRVRF
jgi:hypothetical protein